jgi:hypothetical protein
MGLARENAANFTGFASACRRMPTRRVRETAGGAAQITPHPQSGFFPL